MRTKERRKERKEGQIEGRGRKEGSWGKGKELERGGGGGGGGGGGRKEGRKGMGRMNRKYPMQIVVFSLKQLNVSRGTKYFLESSNI